MQGSHQKKAFNYLMSAKDKLSKVKDVQYEIFKCQNYLLPNQMDNKTVKFLFLARSRMLNVKNNFKSGNSDHFCPVCLDQNENDTQKHLLNCKMLDTNELVSEISEYEDIFSNDTDKQFRITSVLMDRFSRRKKLLFD